MKNDDRLAFATIEELAALLAKRKISPAELTELFLSRIERHNPGVNAFLTVTAEQALAAARRAEKELSRNRRSGKGRHPLLGIPVTLKDNLWTRGIRTTAGSKILRDFVPTADATAARKLLGAGAILLGKTNMHEFAYGITNSNPHYGDARNPWARDRITGGSSGGSAAAIAAGLCAASIGTDTGGSIRIPSALCGIVGLKPTFGRVSVFGTIPLAPSFDHVGPLARSVPDAAILLGLIAGHDPLDPTSSARRVEDFRGALGKPLRKFRLGRPREHYWEKLDSEVRRAAESAIRDLEKHGAVVREVSLPHLSDSLQAATDISLAEATHGHQAAGFFPADAADYSKEVRQRLEAGEKITAMQYLAGMDVRKRLLAEFDAAFREVDAVVTPTAPVPAPLIGADNVPVDGEQIGVRPALVGMCRPANFTGLPAISVPCGFTREGLPVGLQLIGRAFDEATLLRIAHAYEREHDWGQRHPSL
ncbi:MAG: aspartyl/glutamyl-tRNA amidotransferase subunit A [Acidobacteriia bacterium]|nr:aspartyl/glutamyl-tRNA amidotransferase subunit A [Terriglobia bacterium]